MRLGSFLEREGDSSLAPSKMRSGSSTSESQGSNGGPTILSDDLLLGAGAIAEFMFGDNRKRRQVYHLAQTNKLPVFKLGATICARRSTLVAWIEAQETGFCG